MDPSTILNRIIACFLSMLVFLGGPLQCAIAAAPAKPKHSAHQAAQKGLHHPSPARHVSADELTRSIKRQLAFAANPSDFEISNARVFFEPLAPMDEKVNAAENAALAKALLAFSAKNNPEDISDLAAFLTAHPKSRWRPALEVNLGQLRFETGYLSQALKYWKSAWELSKDHTQPQSKAVADEAIGKLLILEARLGMMADLEKQLKSVEKRSFSGSAEQQLKDAREGLWMMQHQPSVSFKCGPFSVNELARLKDPAKRLGYEETIDKAASTMHGTNLVQLQSWAKQIGLDLQIAKRSPGAKVVVPAVLHWAVGHFAAITEFDGTHYRIKDATFAKEGNFLISKQALEAESDGYFLLPAGPLPAGWRPVGAKEASNVWGKGSASQGDDGKTPHWPKECLPVECNCKGMPQATAYSMNASLNIVDVPLTYSPPIGAPIEIRVNFNEYEAKQPGTFTFTNLGQNWSLNWVSYLTVDSSKNATVRVRGGGYELFTNTGTVGSPAYANPDLMSQATLTVSGTNYQRHLPDGSVENFTLSDGTNTYMTSVVDPQSNTVTLTYDANYRLTQISDAAGNAATTLTYVSSISTDPGFYKVASITDGFGRSASFGYDSTTTFLTSIVDAVGNTSSFLYDTGTNFITMMTTPYGSTSFYETTPANGIGECLRFTYPDGSSQIVENYLGKIMMSLVWDREQTALYPFDYINRDFSHCKTTRWLLESPAIWESSVPQWVRQPLESPVVYTYPGEVYPNYCGTSNRPVQKSRMLGEYRYTATITASSITPGDQVGIDLNDPLLPYTTISMYYTVKTGDTTPTIASGLASLINNYTTSINTSMAAFGISASATGSAVTIKSLSPNARVGTRADFPNWCVAHNGSTETVTITTGPNAPQTAYVRGTVTSGDVLTLTVTDSGISGGSKSINYTVQSGDTLASIAQNLAVGFNEDTSLQALGISAMWTSPTTSAPILTLQSNSPNSTTYSASMSGGATETLTATKNPCAIVSFSGVITTGNFVQVYVYDSGLSGGEKTVQYQVAAGDSYATIAQGLANAVNADANLSTIGVTASWSGNRLFTVQSASTNSTTYAVNVVTGGTEVMTLSDSLSQNTFYERNSLGYMTQSIDPIGRVLNYNYASNNIDLVAITENQGSDNFQLGAWSYGSTPHRPSSYTDGSRQQTQYTYNSFGELLTLVDANSGTTSLSYDTNGYLTQINGPLSGSQDVTTFTFFGYGPVHTVTDSEGYVLTYAYDNLNRLTSTTFPDGTTEQVVYDKLDAVMHSDRLGRWTQDNFDVMDQLVCETDPLGRQTKYCWCTCGSLSSLTDPAGNTTRWQRDLQGRVTSKAYADGTSTTYAYVPHRSLVQTRTDALSQVSAYSYNEDDTLQSTLYLNAVNATSPVSIAYDPYFPRMTNTTNGWGAVSYGYNPYATVSSALTDIWIGGSPTTGDRVNVTVVNATLGGGKHNVQYTVTAGDTTLPILASSIKTAINADTTLSAAGISATSAGNVISLSTASSIGAVSTQDSTNASVTETIGGAVTVGNTLSVTVLDAGLTGGSVTKAYTVVGGDTTTSIATALKNAINADTSLSAIGVTATSTGAVVTISSTSANATTYSQSVSGGATETIVQAGGPNETASPAGGGRIQSVANNVIANSTISYAYDQLGRTVNRTINGSANSIDWSYDSMSRVTSELNKLGLFSYAYLNNTSGSSKGDPRLSTISYPNGQTANFSYLPNSQDQRLQQIKNLDPSSAVLSQFNYAFDAAGEITQWQQQQNSANSHYDLGYDAASQLTSAVTDSGSSFKVYITGSVHAGDVVSVTAYDASLTGSSGQESASYTVQAGDSLGSIATSLATNIGTAMSNISVTASANSTTAIITISTSPSFTTSFTAAVSGTGATEKISISGSAPIKNLHKQLYYAYDCAGNRTGVQADSSGSFGGGNFATTSTKYSYNNVNELIAVGAGGPIAFKGTYTNPVKTAVVNVTQTATIGGSINAGDVVTLSVHDNGLSKAENASYVVQSGDTTTTIATALKNIVNADATLASLGVTATSSGATVTLSSSSISATTYTGTVSPTGHETIAIGGGLGVRANISPSNAFTASPVLAGGASSTTNTASVTATSGGGTAATNTYGISINGQSGTTLTFDNNGNMTSDGTNTYSWDAENRLIQITYPGTGNNSQFSYDGLGRCVKIVEVSGGATNSTNQFVWCGNERCEVRDSSGTTVLAQFCRYGETISGTSYYWAKDHLGSIREMSNAAGTVVWQQTFDPYGVPTNIVSTTAAHFGYAGYYLHSRSGLNLTVYRAYNPLLGRWLNRDPLGFFSNAMAVEAVGHFLNLLGMVVSQDTIVSDKLASVSWALSPQNLGSNSFWYAENNPISKLDPLGLVPCPCDPAQNKDDNVIDMCGPLCAKQGAECFQKCRDQGGDYLWCAAKGAAKVAACYVWCKWKQGR